MKRGCAPCALGVELLSPKFLPITLIFLIIIIIVRRGPPEVGGERDRRNPVALAEKMKEAMR